MRAGPEQTVQIVIVDSSRTVLKIVGQLLETAGHRAYPFTDGDEALAYLKANPGIEALITSVELPTISGIELCRMTRELANLYRPIYIMVMSSSQERQRLVEALENGADDFIGKPPATEELIARLRAAERIGTMQRDLVQLAASDPLTGLLNRRAFFEKAEAICLQATPAKPIAAVLFDIDRFKHINDTFGHAVGDQVIRKVAQLAVRECNFAGRIGGEEFALFLHGRPMPDTIDIAERLRARIASSDVSADAGSPVGFTCSFGISAWMPGDTVDEMLHRADLALYRAKETGRNRVLAFDPDTWAGAQIKDGRSARAAAS